MTIVILLDNRVYGISTVYICTHMCKWKHFFLTTWYLQKSTSTCDNNLYVKMGVNDGGLFTPLGGFFLHLENFFSLWGPFFLYKGFFLLMGPFSPRVGGHFVCIWGPFSLCAFIPLIGGGGPLYSLWRSILSLAPL